MALKIPIPFPIFVPLLNPTPPQHHRLPTELRFSWWNNANAEKFNERRRTLQQIEDDIRRQRRFDSATRISDIQDSATPSSNASAAPADGEAFKSIGTPSSPSRPSIPGKKSKYSKNSSPSFDSHPAFRSSRRVRKIAVKELSGVTKEKLGVDRKADVRVGEDGVSYVIDGAPFEFKYSYTETPKSQPIKLREAPYAPFGPTTMPRPWTGRAPLPPSKKKLREFDSFRLPPPHKKGVKPVQAPGPFLPGSGPKYVMSREEILGEPLTEEEIKELIERCRKTKRQLNMGRDGLTHNMLDNIHAHWKRRRVCKIKCKGVCTVDMDNVRQQLEERTGGKIIYGKGGVIFLFRGRNYNYRTRPRFPLMLWKPVTPVYPRLVQKVPEGLTLEEVTEMRKKGHKLMPICKLGKNGVYNNLVNNVREAFEECELVRIDCQGMNGSDYRKIGAKLRDLVPCVLLSFAYEHILIWRGHDWKSSLPKPEKDLQEAKESDVENVISVAPSAEGEWETTSTGSVNDANLELLSTSTLHRSREVMGTEGREDSSSVQHVELSSSTGEVSSEMKTFATENTSDVQISVDDRLGVTSNTYYNEITSEDTGSSGTRLDDIDSDQLSTTSDTIIPNVDVGNAETKSDSFKADFLASERRQVILEVPQDVSQPARLNAPCTEGVLSLLQQAVECGLATILDEDGLDADIVYQRTVAFSQSAPPGPVFRVRSRRIMPKKRLVENSEVRENEKQETEASAPKEITTLPVKEGSGKRTVKARGRKDFGERLNNVVPQGSLRVDELAKLLA